MFKKVEVPKDFSGDRRLALMYRAGYKNCEQQMHPDADTTEGYGRDQYERHAWWCGWWAAYRESER